MHSRARGKSGSKKPEAKVHSWTPYKEKEVEKLVVKYAKAGKTNSEIGMILRDRYGIYSVKTLTSKKVADIVAENNLRKELPDDLLSLIKKIVSIKKHLEKNKQDKTAGHGLILTSSKIRRLLKYYKAQKKIPADFELDMERLQMYLG